MYWQTKKELNMNELSQEIIDYVFSRTKSFKDPEKVKKICEMKLNGATFSKIAKHFGYYNGTQPRDYIYKVMRLYKYYKHEELKKNTNIDTLKPCPFCGGKAEIHNCCELENETAAVVYSGKVGIHCTNCHIATLPFNDIDSATDMWNRRVDNGKL